jgi:hypothetical protein
LGEHLDPLIERITMRKFLVVALTAGLTSVALAAETKKITIDVKGAYCQGCAGKIATALDEGGLKPAVAPKATQEKPQRLVVEAKDDTDLGAAAAKIAGAETPHKAKVAPEVMFVLFADMDKDSAKKAEKALESVKGVEAKATKADADKDEISVTLTGKDKVKITDLLDTLKKDGISARTEKVEKKVEKKGDKKEESKPGKKN